MWEGQMLVMKGRPARMTGTVEDKNIAEKMICDQGQQNWLQLGQLMDSVGWSNRASWIRSYWSRTCRSAICADRICRYICRALKITPSENPWSQNCA